RWRHVGEIGPGVVLAGVGAALDDEGAGAGLGFGVTGEGEAVGEEFAAEAGGGELFSGDVVAVDALGRAGEEGEVIGLAGVGEAVGVDEVGAVLGELTDVG